MGGGILLVDEAYYLYNAANDRDYGQEPIEILLNVMENNKEDLIVVLAGYKDKMDTFYSFIPGMASRIGNHIEFPNYSADQLVGRVVGELDVVADARRHARDEGVEGIHLVLVAGEHDDQVLLVVLHHVE